MHEFDIIRKYFAPLMRASTWLDAGIGEDCALLDGNVFKAAQLAISTDTLVAGKHFPHELPADTANDIATRVLGTTFSDLAACAAEPLGFSLALNLPRVDDMWLKNFSIGLASFMEEWSVNLLGGDLSEGDLSITVHVLGRVPKGQALRRDGARHGDILYLSGCTGEAAAALRAIKGDITVSDETREVLLRRYWQPVPRIHLATELRGLATSAIDISDGLLADATHIGEMSNCCLRVNCEQIPLSDSLRDAVGDEAMDLALGGGDDYELLFTAPPNTHKVLEQRAQSCGVSCTPIGIVEKGSGVVCAHEPKTRGWRHFG